MKFVADKYLHQQPLLKMFHFLVLVGDDRAISRQHPHVILVFTAQRQGTRALPRWTLTATGFGRLMHTEWACPGGSA